MDVDNKVFDAVIERCRENFNSRLLRLDLLDEHRGREVKMAPVRGQHWYTVDGRHERMPSVTTVLKVIDKSGPLIPWAKRTVVDRVRASLLNPELDRLGMSAGDWHAWVWEMTEDAKARPEKESRSAAGKGTSAHEIVSQMLQGRRVGVPGELYPAVYGAIKFVYDYRLVPEALETPVWHPVHGYAGTVDLVARRNGKLVVVDWKRSKGIYSEYAFQSAAYAKAVEALTGESVIEAYVVRLAREGSEDESYEALVVPNVDQAAAIHLAAHRLWMLMRKYPDIRKLLK